MAMGFMAQRKPRGLFGLPDYMTPGGGIGGGVMPDDTVRETAPMGGAAPKKKKGGLFGSPVLRGIAGTIGDALLQQNDMAPVFAPAMQLKQRMEAEERQYQRQREDKRADWQFEQDYERANPKPINNDTLNDLGLIEGRLGRDAGDSYLRRLADPDVTVPLPNGQIYVGPRSGMAAALGGGGSAAPQQATKVIGGKTYYNIGGKWFDDPQGDGGATTAGTRPFDGNRLDHITMMSESGGNPNAISSAGARGLMQVMPGTERAPGFGIRPGNGTAGDRTRVGREYRAKMQQRYGGDLRKMWAAYNWGPGNLDAAIAKYGENGWFGRAPKETKDYIARNLRAAGGR